MRYCAPVISTTRFFLISNRAVLRTLKLYPLKVASISKELSNVIPCLDVAFQGGLFAVFAALLEVVRDAVVIDVAHIVSRKCRTRPALFIAVQPLARHKAVHALVWGFWRCTIIEAHLRRFASASRTVQPNPNNLSVRFQTWV